MPKQEEELRARPSCWLMFYFLFCGTVGDATKRAVLDLLRTNACCWLTPKDSGHELAFAHALRPKSDLPFCSGTKIEGDYLYIEPDPTLHSPTN
jgi:hypothetical protein